MDYITLGNSDLKVSQLGFGCCPMGEYGWGKVSVEDFEEAVLAALDNGINLFDTADIYGLGKSERLLGKFLKGRRHKAIIATKFGVRIDNQKKTFYDNSPVWIENALTESLKRLDTDYIDLYQVHYLDGHTPLEDIFGILEKKRLNGKIRYYGVSNVSFRDISDFVLPDKTVSFQMEYSLANRSNEEEIIKICKEKLLGFISWGSLGQGVLSGKYSSNTKFSINDRRNKPEYINFHGEKFKKNLEIVEKMREISKSINRTLPQIAIRWILDYLGYGCVLVGIKRPKQVIDNITAFSWHLKKDDIYILDSISRNFDYSANANMQDRQLV